MEDSFIEWLNSFGHPIGTWLAIILGGATVIGGIIAVIIKTKKNYDKKLTVKLLKEQEFKEFRKSIQTVAEQVTTIQTGLTDLSSKHDTSINEINSKLEDVWTAVIESQRDSKEGDIALENQIKSYENAIDNLHIKISNMDDKTTLLIESDKEGIKSFIIDKYYHALNDGYIELQVLQGLELRYEKYLQENGNTYIGELMNAIRKMPNKPPSQVRPKTNNSKHTKKWFS